MESQGSEVSLHLLDVVLTEKLQIFGINHKNGLVECLILYNVVNLSQNIIFMKVTLLAIGNTQAKYLQEGIELYSKRLGHYIPFEFKMLPDVKTTKALTAEKQKEMEGEMFLSVIQQGDWVTLLDERGKEFTSREFAAYIDKKMITIPKNLFFIIGGPYGFSKAMYNRANEKLSLSKMTFSHEMIRLFFIEQIYRAMTILKGEPYHHD